jgi:DNA-binding transcriptional ArsR family regulator
MQLADRGGAERTLPAVEVLPSLAMDLSWAIHAAEGSRLQEQHPALRRLYSEHPDLGARVRGFWPEEGELFPELLVAVSLADGLALTDADELWRALRQAHHPDPTRLALRTEGGAERPKILSRLERLAASSKLRNKYAELLAEVWSHVSSEWLARGLPMARASVAGYRRQLERGLPWPELMDEVCQFAAPVLPDLVAERERSGVVTIVPCYFMGCALIIDLPEQVVLGVSAARDDVAARAVTEDLARRLKAIADPTRLAILHSLAGGPRAVGEIAQSFQLAQPTVSAHVKQLRQVGVVRANRAGNRLELAVDPGAVDELFDELKSVLGSLESGVRG